MRSAGRVKRPHRWGVGRRARGHAALVHCWASRGKTTHTTTETERGLVFGRRDKQEDRCVASPTRTQRTSEHQAHARRPIAGHGASMVAVVWGEGGLGSHRASDVPWVVRDKLRSSIQKSNKQRLFLKKQRQPNISIFGALLEFYVFSEKPRGIQKQTNNQHTTGSGASLHRLRE
jgi:hypothetical protein